MKCHRPFSSSGPSELFDLLHRYLNIAVQFQNVKKKNLFFGIGIDDPTVLTNA